MKAKKPAKPPAYRSRPLRIENDNYLWFVTSRTIEEIIIEMESTLPKRQ